jgi:hypothetical protein
MVDVHSQQPVQLLQVLSRVKTLGVRAIVGNGQ